MVNGGARRRYHRDAAKGWQMLDKVRRTIERYGMIRNGDRIGVALSGGPDSVALLKVLALCAGEYGIELVALHLNHGMRGAESLRDEAFVEKLCAEMNVALISGRVSIPEIRKEKKGSWEEIAREERYRFFEETAAEQGLDRIALGHTCNDQAETVLINLLRGSGLEGLRGIVPVREDRFIRPLIGTSREEIMVFLEKEQVDFIVDSSNQSEYYLRNRIRNRLIPALEANYCADPVGILARTADILRIEDDFLAREVDGFLSSGAVETDGERLVLSVPEWRAVHDALKRRIIKRILEERTDDTKGIGYEHIMAVHDLMKGDNPGGALAMPFGIRVHREYDKLVVSRGEGEAGKGDETVFASEVPVPGRVALDERGGAMIFDVADRVDVDYGSRYTVFIDYDRIIFPLQVRTFRPGDRIQPLGMKGMKKVKSLFIDEKVPRGKRRQIPLLVDRDSVLWVPGIHVSERVKITDLTEKVVKIEIIW